MLTDSTALVGSHFPSRYSLKIRDVDLPTDVLRFRGREVLSQPFSWRIEFDAPALVFQPERLLMKHADLIMGDSRAIYGVITRCRWLSTNDGVSHYIITLESRLALFTRTRRCALYQNMSVPEVVERLLRAHALEGHDFEFRLTRRYLSCALIVQWRETDLEFMQRILSEEGIWFSQQMNKVTEQDMTVFCDSQLHYRFYGALPYCEPSGLHDGATYSVWRARAWQQPVTRKIITRDIVDEDTRTPLDSQISVSSPTVATGEHYSYAKPYSKSADDVSAEAGAERSAFYSRLHHERLLNQSARVHLLSNAVGLSPGMVINPEGVSLGLIKNGVIITAAVFNGTRDKPLKISVWGMPYHEEYCFRPVEIPRPVISGTLPGKIDSRLPHDRHAYLDNQGRYRVHMDFNLDDCESGHASPWLRLAKPCASATSGWHTPVLAGTEVAVAFSCGDPYQPYIAHAFHDSDHADVVNQDNRSQNILRTRARNELRLEDKRGEEHVHLSTQYGKTQLELGHLVDGQDKPRGRGVELRTDEQGVLRAAKGLFISADAPQKAAGDALDLKAAHQEIHLCLQQLRQLDAAAHQAKALQADIHAQISMFNQRLKPLNRVIHCFAPQGMAFTSGEHLQLAAGEHIAINALGECSIGVMGNMTALAGEKLGLFANSGQLSLLSSTGPVAFKAQKGTLALSAAKKVAITSAGDMLMTGKKRIILNGAGSYLKIEAGAIEYGTQHAYVRKVKRTATAGPDTMPLDIPALGDEAKHTLGVISGKDNVLCVTPTFTAFSKEEE